MDGEKHVCPKKDALLQARAEATREYASAVRNLAKLRQSHTSFNDRAWKSEQARIKAEQARLNYERHVSEHGC